MIFCKLDEQFLRVWESFAQPREFDHHFCPGAGELDKKNLSGWPGFAGSKKVSLGLPGGADVPSWN